MEHGRSSDKPMRHPSCLCGKVGDYNEKYDSYYCPDSFVWLEEAEQSIKGKERFFPIRPKLANED